MVDESNYNVNSNIEKTESNKLKSITQDIEKEIVLLTKESLHEVSVNITKTKKPLIDSKKVVKDTIQEKIDKKLEYYANQGYDVICNITSVTPSNNPFRVTITYKLLVSNNNYDSMKINRNKDIDVEITDNKYPVYDTLPVLKVGAVITDNTLDYQNKLYQHVDSDAYKNVKTNSIILKCPIDDYHQHGNDNDTLISCILNGYYHNSHDGLCLLCRFENKTSCEHMGIETFVLPTKIVQKAPVSIDHVLLNDSAGQYEANNIILNNTTIVYLDNGHRAKYGL